MNEETAEFVKAARTKLKLTQAGLAESIGMERRSIVRFEAGDDLPILVKLAIEHLLTLHKARKKRRAARQETKQRASA